MNRGRPRTPSKVKIIRHTFRKDRAKNEPDPEVITEVPTPPRGLNVAGRRLWKQAATEMVSLGLLTTADVHLFATACRLHGHAAALDKEISHYKDESGKTRKRDVAEYLHETVPMTDKLGNPILVDDKPLMVTVISKQRLGVVRLMRELDMSAARLLADFGFTPAARSRLDIGPAEKPSESVVKRMMNEA